MDQSYIELHVVIIIMAIPLIFTFNIRRSVFEQFGPSIFAHLTKLKLQSENLILLPIVNNLDHGIEQRAGSLSNLLPKLLQTLEINQCHLISYSLSGIDARFAISQLGLASYVKSLSTISTPHQGSRLAWLSQRRILRQKQIEPISRLLGVGLRPFWEVTPESMKYFNQRIIDSPTTQYCSIGSERLPNNMTKELIQTGDYLRKHTQANFIYENDGVFGHNEFNWGEHLVNFQADHTQIVGLNPNPELESVFRLIEDNVLHHEQATQG